MINPEHIQKICAEYDLGESIKVEEILEGALNHNYALETTKDKYFIKSIREKKKEQSQYVYDVEVFMGSKGIPAITLLKTLSGKISLEIDGNIYRLYEYIESDRGHTYSLEEYRDMGALLACIHSVGSQTPDTFQEKQLKVLSRPLAMERLEGWKKDLLVKTERTDIEELFLRFINLKLDLISKLGNLEVSPNSTLIHGDYHQGNLLVSKETREIIGVCDWELALIAPRGYELARSIMYVCFGDEFEVESATEKAKSFLAGYNSTLPILALD